MNKRQFMLLRILYAEQDFLTLGELAGRLGVSSRTVRSDILFAREFLSEHNAGRIDSKPHIGIRLICTTGEWSEIENFSPNEDEEIFFFIMRSLFKYGILTAQKLSDKYYISRGRLDKILDRVSDKLSKSGITLSRRRGTGISISGSEFNFRIALLKFFNEYSKSYSALINERTSKYSFLPPTEYTGMCAALGGFEADIAAKIVINAEDRFGIKFNRTSAANLTFLLSLCILRTRSFHPCEMKSHKLSDFDAPLAKMLFKEAKKHAPLPPCELDFMTSAVSISEIQEFQSAEHRRSFELLNINFCRLTINAVNLASEITGVDLKADRLFTDQMLLLIKAAAARLSYGVVFPNRLLSQIKEKYPNMLAAAWILGNIFEKELSLELNEHEAGYIALQTGGAIERSLSQLSACIVCDYGVGIQQLFKEKIAASVPDIKIKAVYSARDIDKISECDFVISAVPIKDFKYKVIEIGQLPDDNDIRTLRRAIKEIRLKKRSRINNIVPGRTIFNRDLIFPQCGISDKDRLLHMMCSRLERLGYVTSGFEKSVLRREKSTSTDIGRGFALPHGSGRHVIHSAAAFASLEKPIVWNSGESADIIFLLAFDINEDDNIKNKIMRFYKSAAAFIEDESKCGILKNLSDIDEIIKIFESW